MAQFFDNISSVRTEREPEEHENVHWVDSSCEEICIDDVSSVKKLTSKVVKNADMDIEKLVLERHDNTIGYEKSHQQVMGFNKKEEKIGWIPYMIMSQLNDTIRNMQQVEYIGEKIISFGLTVGKVTQAAAYDIVKCSKELGTQVKKYGEVKLKST